jgi:hypothetical protein
VFSNGGFVNTGMDVRFKEWGFSFFIFVSVWVCVSDLVWIASALVGGCWWLLLC